MPFSKNQYSDFCYILSIPLTYKISPKVFWVFLQSYLQFLEKSNQENTLAKMLYFDNKSVTVKIRNNVQLSRHWSAVYSSVNLK